MRVVGEAAGLRVGGVAAGVCSEAVGELGEGLAPPVDEEPPFGEVVGGMVVSLGEVAALLGEVVVPLGEVIVARGEVVVPLGKVVVPLGEVVPTPMAGGEVA